MKSKAKPAPLNPKGAAPPRKLVQHPGTGLGAVGASIFAARGYCKWILGFEGEAQAIERKERGPPFSKNERVGHPGGLLRNRWTVLSVTHPPELNPHPNE